MSHLEIVIAKDPEALASLALERLVAATGGRLRIALAGGTTPRRLYTRLAGDERIDWSRIEIFFGDERVVAKDDEASNFRMVREALLDHVPIPPENVHRIETERGSAGAARHYRELVSRAPLDLVLLGMGADGHTASLFPRTPGLAEARGVVVTESPVPPKGRVSIALDVINGAREAWLLVSGADKAERLAEVYAEWHGSPAPELPAAMVRPRRLVWLVDEDAAKRLPNPESRERS